MDVHELLRVDDSRNRRLRSSPKLTPLRKLKPENLTYERCLSAVRVNGYDVQCVPVKFLTEELCIAAVSENSRAFSFIPDAHKTKTLCEMCVSMDSKLVAHVPPKLATKDMYELAVSQNGLALCYVPGNRHSKKLCTVAVTNNPLALEYVRGRFLTPDLCEMAIAVDWRAFAYVLDDFYSFENCIIVFESLVASGVDFMKKDYGDRLAAIRIINRFSNEILNDSRIVSLLRRLNVRYFDYKRFNPETNRFETKERSIMDVTDEDALMVTFAKFSDFYEYLCGDLQGSDLYQYDFENEDLKLFDVSSAGIRTEILLRHGVYDDSYYNRVVCPQNSDMPLVEDVDVSIQVDNNRDLFIASDDSILNDNTRRIFYISDIHLNHKISEAFPNHGSELDIKKYINGYVADIFKKTTGIGNNDALLIAGDVSSLFEISALFYKELVSYFSPGRIIVVLGNHELWEFDDVTSAIYQYRVLFNRLGIRFLENELLVKRNRDVFIISENDLLTLDAESLHKFCRTSDLMIFGGIGFSGYNPSFNASNGLYRGAVRTISDDKSLSARFDAIYNRLHDILEHDKLIVLTHMPKNDWSNTPYAKNWVHVSGHTHRNHYRKDEDCEVHADNQVGYKGANRGLKYFSTKTIVDIFRHYADGIYVIERDEYLNFNWSMGIRLDYNAVGKIHMLKNKGLYCFLFENPKNGLLTLLAGGQRLKLTVQDLNYYFNRMVEYSQIITDAMSEYYATLKNIADRVKAIGGSGYIHGNIIDIDFYNHIYVNPHDGKVTAYQASSIVDKQVYSDLNSLLLEERPDLHANYLRLLGKDSGALISLDDGLVSKSNAGKLFVADTDMYKPSRVFRSLQYMADVKVIRVWNDALFQNGKMLE